MTQQGADWLTGLPGMVQFHELAAEGASRLREQGFQPAAIALDLVGMKSYNSRFGREEGDALLRGFADLLVKHFGDGACSRFGEDHFYAFAPADALDEKLEALFAEFESENKGKSLPIRAGVCVCEDGDDIVADGFDRAKIACDLDKKTWQSHALWFDEDMMRQAQLRIYVLDNVDRAIAEGWIRPYYQAQVRSATGYLCGEEALARWIDPDYGELHPDQFIPVLEEAGLLQKVDMHIIDCVIADMAIKRKHGVPPAPVSVNVSLKDLGKLDIAEEVTRRTAEVGLPHHLLRIEFTESAASEDPEALAEQISALHNAGFEVWLDDFGSGYSSLNTLQEFYFDLLKLDMEFVRSLGSARAREILAGVVRVSKKLGMGVLAEGIELEEQAEFLESVGCDMFQGFLYTKPLPLEEIIRRFEFGGSLTREDRIETQYWDHVGAVDLVDPLARAAMEGRGSSISEYPTGVIEHRNDAWWLVRSNAPFREFLERKGVLTVTPSLLNTTPITLGNDKDLLNAIGKSAISGSWERIAGRLEYGTGFQFYLKPVASSSRAQAFVIASAPNMLGAVLGSYGDVPAAYAVFRALLNDAGNEVVDAEYVYANSVYCKWGGYEYGNLAGQSFLAVNESANVEWFPYCYRAAVLKESVHDVLYSPEFGHWLSFSIAPSPVEGCCVLAFMIADDERREREAMIRGLDTSGLIIDIANSFSSGKGYDASMNEVLEMLCGIINPSRLFIYERGGDADRVSFEWCAKGVVPQLSIPRSATPERLEAWDKVADDASVVYIPDVAALAPVDAWLHQYLVDQGAKCLLAAPLHDGDTLVGYLVAVDYSFNEGIDVKGLLRTVAPYIGSRIANHRLAVKLGQA